MSSPNRSNRRLQRVTTFLGENSFFVLLIVAGLFAGGIPVVLAGLGGAWNNPVTIGICTFAQMFVSIFAGVAWSKAQAQKEANMKWVPMAASACDRLVTIMGTVSSLRTAVAIACTTAGKNLPELHEERNKALRVHFEGLCSSNASRLSDAEGHLDNALSDWERFIRQNCTGRECAEMGRRLLELRSKIASAKSPTACAVPPTAPQTNSTAHDDQAMNADPEVTLSVVGVTTREDANGTWTLARVSSDYWVCEKYCLRKGDYGWYVEERANSDSFFYLEGTESASGLYTRCEICPDDGSAVVSVNQTEKVIATSEPISSAVSRSPVVETMLVNFALINNPYTQHLLGNHGKALDTVRDAVLNAQSIQQFCALAGTTCPDLASECAVQAMNAIRSLGNKPLLGYDPAFHTNLLSTNPSESDARRAEVTAVTADGTGQLTMPTEGESQHE